MFLVFPFGCLGPFHWWWSIPPSPLPFQPVPFSGFHPDRTSDFTPVGAGSSPQSSRVRARPPPTVSPGCQPRSPPFLLGTEPVPARGRTRSRLGSGSNPFRLGFEPRRNGFGGGA
eukprot:scaffold131_cov335-Pavlova_lutheri.AAC.33